MSKERVLRHRKIERGVALNAPPRLFRVKEPNKIKRLTILNNNSI